LSSNLPTQDGPSAHVGFSREALDALAAEDSFLNPELPAPLRQEISQFVIGLIAANNAALFLDSQLIDRRCDELQARLLELELLTGIASEFASTPSHEGPTVSASDSAAEP
jgi:hypothetical protein